MDDGHNAIDIFKFGKPAGFFRLLGHKARDAARTIYRGQHTNIITGAKPSVTAWIAHKEFLLGGRRQCCDILGKVIVLAMVAHADIVGMNMIARRNIGGGRPDNLTIAQHRVASRNRAGGDFVPACDRCIQENPTLGKPGTLGQITERNFNIVAGVQQNAVWG